MSYIEIENKEKNKGVRTEAQIKQQIIIKVLNEKTQKIIRILEQNQFGDKHSVEQIHFQAYERFSREVEEYSLTFFMHKSSLQGVKIVNLFDNFISNLRKMVAFVQRELAKKQNGNQRKKIIDLFCTQKNQVCEKCENMLLQKKVELQKNKILFGQIDDPFNLFKTDKEDFQKLMQTEQEPTTADNIDSINNQKIVKTQIDKLKDRIIHRTDEIIALISEFKKYEKENLEQNESQHEKKYFFKKYETCMQEMIAILKSKFFALFSKFKVDEINKEKKSVEVQAGNSVNQLINFYQRQSESFAKDLQIKERQKEELKRMISELQLQILNNSEEKEQIKQKYLSISEQNSTKVVELQNQKANHKVTNKRLSDVTKMLEQIRNQLKEKNVELAKLQQNENPRKNNRKATKIWSQKKKQRSSIESRKNEGTQKDIFSEQKKMENQYQITDEMALKSTPKSIKKFKVNRRPTLNQNQDSIIENGVKNNEEGQNSHFRLHSDLGLVSEQIPTITVKQVSMQSSFSINDSQAKTSGKVNNNLLKVSKQQTQMGQTFRKDQFPHMNSTKESIFPKMGKRSPKQSLQSILKNNKENEKVHQEGYSAEISLQNNGRIPRASAPMLHKTSSNLMGVKNSDKYRKFIQSKANKKYALKGDKQCERQDSRTNSVLYTENSEDSRQVIHPTSLNKYKKLNRSIQNFHMNQTLDFLATTMKEQKPSDFGLTSSFFHSQDLPSNYDAHRFEITEVFKQEDVENLFFHLEGAIQHENAHKNNRKTREFYLSLPHNIKYLTRLLATIARINSKNRSLYEAVKGILIFPYQSIIAQQNFIFISKSMPSSGKIKEAVNQIIGLHRNCEGRDKICQHLKKFLEKLEQVLEEENEDK